MKDEIINEKDIKKAIHQSVTGQTPTVEFEKIWEESQRIQMQTVATKKMSRKISKKKMLVMAAALAATLGVTTLSAEYFKRIDDVSYHFKMDQKALGSWTVVDFVEKESDFKPSEKKWEGEGLRLLELKENGEVDMAIEENGTIKKSFSSFNWTQNHMISELEETNSRYKIKKIDGKNYMFLEWKSGDYSFKGKEASIYVLEQGQNIDIPVMQGRVDDTNIPFENDEAMIGTWEAVDYVKQIEDFNPQSRYWPELFLKTLVLGEKGTFSQTCVDEKCNISSTTETLYWTKGAVVNKWWQTVSDCTIKEIEGETYLFYEWKNGDYMVAGLTPYYYVLKKQH